MAEADLDEAHEIAHLLFSAVDLTRQRFEQLCESFDMTPAQARALMALDGPTPMSELAAQLRCDPSNITGLADRLEARGLVERRADEHDRRVKHLAPTPAGLATRKKLESALRETSPFMAGLGAKERGTLRALLEKLNATRDRPEEQTGS